MSIPFSSALPESVRKLSIRRRVHRYIGRLYGLCADTISWSSLSFLFGTIPKNDVFRTAVCYDLIASVREYHHHQALLAIRKCDIGSHREFMTLNYSLMLSAPVLRIGWLDRPGKHLGGNQICRQLLQRCLCRTLFDCHINLFASPTGVSSCECNSRQL